MIRFSAVLVVIAVAVLIGGVATSTLMLVYVAIVLSAAALIALAIGVARKRDELFGGTGRPVGDVMGSAAGRPYLSGQSGGYPAGGQGYTGHQGYTGQSFPGQGFAGQTAPGAGGNPGTSGPGNPAAYGDAYGATATPSAGYGAGPGAASGPPTPRVTSAPGRSAPLPSSRSVTQTRADLTALGPDTPQAGGQPPAAGSPQGPGSPRPSDPRPSDPRPSDPRPSDPRPSNPSRPAGMPGQADADETRTDLPPIRPDSPAPSGSRSSGADETRLDMSPAVEDGDPADRVVSSRPMSGGASGVSSSSRSPETRSDLPAQRDTPAQYGSAGSAAMPEPKPMTGDSQVAVIPGVPRYHAPGCILIRFMDSEDLEMQTLDEAKAAGCTPCTACQAD